MSKVYISFLGTNDYLPCIYYRDKEGFQCENVRFVQEATIRYACSDWTSDDRILIFTTGEALKKNWRNNGHVDHKTKRCLVRTGLKECIACVGLQSQVMRVEIPEGKSEEEIWEIFNIVFESLEKGDEVIFDITHAFRSIPMLAIVILNYSKVMKNVALRGVFYGAFEVLGSIYEAKEKPLAERRVPIFDLTTYDQLLDWTVAVDRFVEAGDASLIDTLARSGLKQILTESKGRDGSATAIRDIGATMKTFCVAMATCRTEEIKQSAIKLKSQITQCPDTGLLPPFKPLFRMLGKQIETFKGDNLLDGIAAAEWCLQHNLVQQGATILREVMITYLLYTNGRDVNDSDEREYAAYAISEAFRRVTEPDLIKPQEEAAGAATQKIDLYRRILDEKPRLVKIWGRLARVRNDLNHAGYVNDPMRAVKFSSQLPELIEGVKSVIMPSFTCK